MQFKELEKDLKTHLSGDVHFDEISRKIYSVDASIYEIDPIGIVLPRSKEDLIEAVKIAKKHRIPIIPRGAATGITGGCIGKALILDTSKYLNRILHIDYANESVTCEPGVVQDVLNATLASHGYRLGPDTSTGNRATLGGMLANNSAGARSLRYGKMVDHVQSVELLLACGSLMTCQMVDEESFNQKQTLDNSEGRIYRTLHNIRQNDAEEIELRFPKIPRRVSGYNLDELIKPFPLNISQLIAGSEGTLGICTEITMHISKKPMHTALGLLYFHNLITAMHAVMPLLSHQPLAIEMIDHQIIDAGRRSPPLKNKLEWLRTDAKILIFVEFDAQTLEELNQKLKQFQDDILTRSICDHLHILTNASQIAHVWEMRKAGLGLLLSKRSYSRAIAFIEDVAVPPENLASFMQKLTTYLQSQGKEAGIYGHVGAGCMHVRPYMDLRNPKELQKMQQIMDAVSSLVLEEGGSMSGEHGDGRVRSWLHEKMFGEKIVHAFQELKTAFDPDLRMNPGKIVFPTPFLEDLRQGPQMQPSIVSPFLDFTREGGFDLSVDLCNGNGRCRKGEGTMCPSFQATQDEYDTTRARAQALRALIRGDLANSTPSNAEVHAVLDLCLECKGCKTECPSQVDMAKMKAEMTYQYQQKHGIPLRSRLFGQIGRVNWLLSHMPTFFNWLLAKQWFKNLQTWGGIAFERSLPPLNTIRFSTWFKKYTQPTGLDKQVVLFNDTFTEFNELNIGQSAVKVLNALGYFVILPAWQCCGRPLISKGMLVQAREKADALIQSLSPLAEKDLFIIGLEPSCILTIQDDFQDLTQQAQDQIKKIKGLCLTFDEFISKHLEKEAFPTKTSTETPLKLHVHCHQKALVGTSPSLAILKSLPNHQVELIQAGCCGMAGSFGYEKEHYGISMKIGELHLFPAIRQAPEDTKIIANGMSCRAQIKQGTNKKAQHLAEFLADILNV
ncbi:FAD-binding and (Fe-S)-binding domain-containing protein [Parachlamydia acanthamoebae]|uniref:FAD-binding and (Fe-S)-binding domain-containing protein n=1 Tax=Parachlamydia acanthamoebae TaxID=83552 RepID=UPI0007515D9B|nr:FAD-binding and (Fe-S)-binding domain-containing protein [Parachlamydia acanthamoebae]